MKKNKSKWLSLAALPMFAAAVFQIAADHFLPGIVFFAAAAGFTASAAAQRKKEQTEEQNEGKQKEEQRGKEQGA